MRPYPKDTHPETKEDEIFLTNTTDVTLVWTGWKTCRIGDKAYNISGEWIPERKPVFIKKSEWDDFFNKEAN